MLFFEEIVIVEPLPPEESTDNPDFIVIPFALIAITPPLPLSVPLARMEEIAPENASFWEAFIVMLPACPVLAVSMEVSIRRLDAVIVVPLILIVPPTPLASNLVFAPRLIDSPAVVSTEPN
jgi:hypothetical protein